MLYKKDDKEAVLAEGLDFFMIHKEADLQVSSGGRWMFGSIGLGNAFNRGGIMVLDTREGAEGFLEGRGFVGAFGMVSFCGRLG